MVEVIIVCGLWESLPDAIVPLYLQGKRREFFLYLDRLDAAALIVAVTFLCQHQKRSFTTNPSMKKKFFKDVATYFSDAIC